MATVTLTEPESSLISNGRLFLRGAKEWYGDFRDDLQRDGYAVIKGAVPRVRAENYVEQIYKFLEDFGLGFKRDDPSTIHKDFLPTINEKGMCSGYGLPHAQFTWDIRAEPGVVGAFEKVYQTEDLIVSFDAINIGFPNRKDLEPNNPWPHQDQDPEKPGFRVLQGLVNLLPNGPDDGGLIVCPGGHLLSEEFHEQHKDEPNKVYAWTKEWYGFTEAGMKWLADKGLTWHKVCMESGDLVVWDSRTPHYSLTSKTGQPRFATYTCYMPVEDASQEDLIRKKEAFEECKSTTHWPNAVYVGGLPVLRNGKPDPYHTDVPKTGRPVLSERAFKLTGIPYIKTQA